MIIDFENISTYKSREISGELNISQVTKLHNLTGVFFSTNIDEQTNDFLYFTVAAIDKKGEIQDKKTFDGKTSKSFFEAVDYFEKLINDRIPQEEQKQPSIGKFFFVKKMDSMVKLTMLSDETIVIDREDIDKVFSPPKTKPFGRLNMFEVDKEKYEPIKGKFALKYNQEETKLFLEQMSMQEGDAVVYDMTPYSTDQQQEDGSTPDDVNDDELSLDKIENENPEDLKGDNKPKEDEGKSDQEDKSQKDGKEDIDTPDSSDQQQDDQKDGDDQKGGKPKDQNEPSDDESQKGQGQSNDQNQGEEGEIDEDKQSNQQTGSLVPSNVDEILSNYLGVEDIVYDYRKQKRMLDALSLSSEEQLKQNLYQVFDVDKNKSKSEFLSKVEQVTKTYFES